MTNFIFGCPAALDQGLHGIQKNIKTMIYTIFSVLVWTKNFTTLTILKRA
jgi:hypothetical protein